MRDCHAYDYAVLRIVPHVEREEFVNVGVILSCPDRALLPAPRRPAVIDDRCTDCGACIEVCPRDAITEVRLHG